MINFFRNLALFRVKNAKFFAKFFVENIFKIITSVPGERALSPALYANSASDLLNLDTVTAI
jgi:hypothetical protein